MDLVHIDPHCDLYGALVLPDGAMSQVRQDEMHEGNFLVTAVKEGIVKKIDWVFDDYGNRKYDYTTVLFHDDFIFKLHWVQNRVKKLEKYPLEYNRIHYSQWAGMTIGQHLSLDWDFFAFTQKPRHTIQSECQAFLDLEWQVFPKVIYFCYSHEYVHPYCLEFIKFTEQLAEHFDAELEFFHRKIQHPQLEQNSGSGWPQIIAERVTGKVCHLFRRLVHKIEILY